MTYEDRINWLKTLGMSESDAKLFWASVCDDAGMLYDAAQNNMDNHIAYGHSTRKLIECKKEALTNFGFLVPK